MLTPSGALHGASSVSSPSSASQSLISTLSNMSTSTRQSHSYSSNSHSQASAGKSNPRGQASPHRKVRIESAGPTIIDDVQYNSSSCHYANGFSSKRPSSASDFDQNSSSSNSSASYVTKQPKATKVIKPAQQNHSEKYLKPQLYSDNVINSGDEGQKSNKPKHSPKHLLYEVLLSPIKRKSRNNRATTSQKLTELSSSNKNENQSTDSKKSKIGSTSGGDQTANAQSGTGTNRSASTTPLDRNYYNFQNNQSSTLFDEDPGIMSEIETSATGFRRGNKIRSSLPVVRTPSKSQDRSLGLVFLQFRSETKRALLPNEITSIDTVKALFVRSFPRQLSMEYLEHPSVRIYIHDPSKDMFYELEDLRDVKDRCILRIYEHGVNGPQPGGGLPHPIQGQGFPSAAPDAEGYGYFSEPEFDSEFQNQHIHRKRFPPPMVGQSLVIGPSGLPQSQYYGTIMLPPAYRSATLGPRSSFFPSQNMPGQPPQPPTRNKAFTGYSQTLPRGTHLMSPTSVSSALTPFGITQGQHPAPPKPQRTFPATSPVPQAGIIMIQGPAPRTAAAPAMPPSSTGVPQPGGPYPPQTRPLPDRPYSVAGHYPTLDRAGTRLPFPAGNSGAEFSGYLSSPEHRPNPTLMSLHSQPRASFSGYPTSRMFDGELGAVHNAPGMFPPTGVYGARQASNMPVMDEEARVRMHEMERQIASLTNVVSKALGSKPPPPPKPAALIGYRSEIGAPLQGDNLSQLRQIRRKARDLRSEVRALKKFTQQHTNTTRETIKETCAKIQSTLSFLTSPSDAHLRLERLKISTNCDDYNEDALRLDKDLLELEAQVEALRSNVINRRCRVNMSHVESMALILSRASKTVADLKARYPGLAQALKSIMTRELQEIEREEKFLKEEPERLEHSLKRCKKLTGTLVTLKRLASVQEQRSSSNTSTSSPSQMLQASDKKESSGSGDENSCSAPAGLTRAKRMQAWRRSANFRQPISSHNYKIDLCRGFASMPTIQEPNSETSDAGNECQHLHPGAEVAGSATGKQAASGGPALNRQSVMSKSYDVDLMEPHTIIQVTPATPSSTASSGTGGTAATILDNLLDELQTFSKQSSMDSPSSGPAHLLQRSSGSFRSKPSTDTLSRKAARSKSYSSIRATSEPPGVRARGASIPDGKIDLDSIALLASTCGNAAAATAALVEKRFAQSRQELLEQRHQELLRKQRQLQEQYTRLQQLSRGQLPRGFLSDLKKTGSESNIMAKALASFSEPSSKSCRVPLSSTVHGSLRNLANATSTCSATLPNIKSNNTNASISSIGHEVKKVFETDIL